jgi:hypothetical protein
MSLLSLLCPANPPVNLTCSGLAGQLPQVSGYPGGLNGSTQHQLEVHLREPRTLKSFASIKSNKNTTLYRFNEYRLTARFALEKHCPINRLEGVASTV